MSLYVDSSALLKLYVREPDSDVAEQLVNSDATVVTARVTVVEVRRNLSRLLESAAAATARGDFLTDLGQLVVVELSEAVCDRAAAVAELTGVKAVDALHLGAAQSAGVATFLTFDIRQAQAARTLGLTVVGD